MKTFFVPGEQGESFQAYCERVSGLAWTFNADRNLTIAQIGEVSLDGDKPAGSDFAEKPAEEAPAA